MESIVVQIAGVNILVSFKYPKTRLCLSDFETDEDFKYKVVITDCRFQEEKNLLERRFPLQSFQSHEIERNSLYRDIPKILVKEGIIMIHGVVVAMDGEGFLFTAPSGTGKSTHAKMWTEAFPNKAIVINGDKPLLKITDSGVIAYGSPWKGKERIGTNDFVKLNNICLLKRGNNNSIKRVEWNAEILTWLLEQSQIDGADAQVLERIRWFKAASQYISFFELQCTKSIEAAIVAYNGMR